MTKFYYKLENKVFQNFQNAFQRKSFQAKVSNRALYNSWIQDIALIDVVGFVLHVKVHQFPKKIQVNSKIELTTNLNFQANFIHTIVLNSIYKKLIFFQ